MIKAINQHNKLIHIIESSKEDKYICPICKESLTRKFGKVNQYFAHPKGKGLDCELKLEIKLKQEQMEQSKQESDVLAEFYNKDFSESKVELSDYMSEDGYYLTEQQKKIIFAKEDRIIVSALAGAAKSSTLYYYCKERPTKRFLYIVYNKSQQIEAQNTFGKLRNVEIKTVHGLAYKYVGKLYQQKLAFNYGVVDIIKDLNLNWNSDKQLAAQIKEFMNEFMLSNADTFDELEIYEDIKGNERRRVINMCERLWELKKIYKNSVKVEHDFYLKLFQLSKTDLSQNYDGITLDESQDSSALTLSLILNSNVKNIVMVGDHYQSLYKWRKSINIMKLLPDATEYKLTTSFRVSQNIAELSNILVSNMLTEDINMTGFNTKQKIVDEINQDKQHAILCRSNAMIFAEAIENSHKKIFYNGGFKGYNFNNVKDAYFFSCGRPTTNPLFVKFKNYNDMIVYAQEVTDVEILSLDAVLKKYGSKIPQLVDNVDKNSTDNADKCDIWISTIHKSKGSTIKMPMRISDDHYDLENLWEDMSKPDKKDMLFENCCLIYVAITRCAGEIQLSDRLKTFLANRLMEDVN